MPYALEADITLAAGGPDRFTALADWDNDQVADANVIAAAQSAADSYIDDFLGNSYDTPITNPSDTLVRIAAEEAVFWMRSKREMMSDIALKERDSRERQLMLMAEGKLRPDSIAVDRSQSHRARFVENDMALSRRGTKGIW